MPEKAAQRPVQPPRVPWFLGAQGMAGGQATGYLSHFRRPMARNDRKKAWPWADFGRLPSGDRAVWHRHRGPGESTGFSGAAGARHRPFAPGGGVDTVAPLIALKLSAAGPAGCHRKQAGRGRRRRQRICHASAGRRYIVLIRVAGSHAIAQYLNPNLGYDPVRDFAGVTVLSYSPLICLVAPSSPFPA